MQMNRCPVCHSRIGLEAMAQDDAGRELLALLTKLDTLSGSALVSYLGLFRSESRDLAADRALRLAKECLALGPLEQVAQAMRLTVEAMREKTGKPLSNHNYLKKVLADVPPGEGYGLISRDERPSPRKLSRTQQALDNLEEFGRGDA